MPFYFKIGKQKNKKWKEIMNIYELDIRVTSE